MTRNGFARARLVRRRLPPYSHHDDDAHHGAMLLLLVLVLLLLPPPVLLLLLLLLLLLPSIRYSMCTRISPSQASQPASQPARPGKARPTPLRRGTTTANLWAGAVSPSNPGLHGPGWLSEMGVPGSSKQPSGPVRYSSV